MAELKTIARPYAEAAFKAAVERQELARWDEMLSLAAAVVGDPRVLHLVQDPQFDRARLTGLVLDVAGKPFTKEMANFIQVLVENRRLLCLPQIAVLFRERKNEHESKVQAHVVSAFALEVQELSSIAQGLKKKLNRDVVVNATVDKSLIGGVIVRAGDLTIDASVRGRLANLAATLNS
jgi:F-type H+-transporting ATPase subunit delta